MNDKWNDAGSYESYVGRWSRLTAIEFLKWLDLKSGLVWLDAGCGTGALTEAILKFSAPEKVTGIDPSKDHVEYCSQKIINRRTEFLVTRAEEINLPDNSVDAVVSGLVLNFIPELNKALKEFRRITKPGGTVAAYVWDYSGKMEFMRYFWDAAVKLFDDAREKDEGVRFPICNEANLADAFSSTGFNNTETAFLDIPTVFKDFNDYWEPFLSGIGPAPGYCMSLSKENRELLKKEIQKNIPVNSDGSILLTARAIAIRAEVYK